MDIVHFVYDVDLTKVNLKTLDLQLDKNTHNIVTHCLRYFLMLNGVSLSEIRDFCTIHKTSIKSQEIRLLIFLRTFDNLALSGSNQFARQQIKYSLQLINNAIECEYSALSR